MLLRHAVRRFTLALVCAGAAVAHADPATAPAGKDPHYTAVGFFDIHVCSWPDRPLFFMALFSSAQYDLIKEVEVLTPGGARLLTLDLARYNVLRKPGKPDKHVFISQTPVARDAENGWYNARITTTDGRVFEARDYVRIAELGQPNTGLNPPDRAQNVAVPRELSWAAIPGASHYKVFIRDMWDGGKMIHESKLLTEPRLVLPDGLLKADGWYMWRVHARDINEDVVLGDFNHGSLGREAEFLTVSGQ